MNRPPLARQRVLDAARRIVETRGAGHLTYEMLAEESGLTRGGITYHFPTKEALLKALIEADLAQWEEAAQAEVRAQGEPACPGQARAARLLGQVRCSLAGDDEAHRRFVSGLLSAAMADPELLDPVRAHVQREFADWRWDEADLERYLLLLAADGLFWSRLFGLSPVPAEVRLRLAARIEQRLRDLTGLAASEAPSSFPSSSSSDP
jgi:AcrR family transcriptional regulator